ncbi:MAG: undecaprenyl/decaprenyl-phosphate alpha-N-acetylglucosaminyl 1-phosphate transferase [Candidatus Omnitrophica bacterium]|nr:undecaprenyl/decaprenyl-phosphate alpha-N-acetylglucosaminyl 1-phosphate transferase [Candidatus Omnitrophota bacterium]MCM8801858.1 undecaprenyl/decaprenyl-phosphate alpha-N-acetylglucosaminyl 1-phosphate transferase [Candidatus Omnitrophota bacterium]
MWEYLYLILFFISFFMSLFLTFLFGKLAKKVGILAIPSERKIHKKPTPLFGGLGIFCSFFLVVVIGILFVNYNLVPEFIKKYISGIYYVLPKLLSIILCGIIVIFFGLIDDVYELKALQKLFFQFITGTIIFLSGIRITFFISNTFLSYLITCLWIILMMNSFNLLDNMDGLSAGVAIITGIILFIFAFEMKQLFIATILSVFLGSTCGFLFYNFPPAKIFMGESGSSFLGYFLGITSILLTYYKYEESKTFLPVFIPLIVFSVPFFDTISVIVIRKKRGYPIFQADKNHLSHRLVSIGMTQKQAILFIYLLTLTTGINALILKNLNVYGGIEVLFEVILILVIVAILEFFGRKWEN